MNDSSTRCRLRLARPVACALLLLPSLAACAPASAPPAAAPASGAAQSAAAAPASRQGGTLRFATSGAPEQLNPLASTSRDAQITLWSTFYDPLLNNDFLSVDDFRADFPLKPWLVETWEMKGDTTHIFHLRKGVKFHDGKPMTADDVLWSLEYARDPANAFEARAVLTAVDRMEKVDDSTIRIVLKGVAPNFLIDLASTVSNAVVVLPKHVFDQGGEAALQTQGIGTGPYKLRKFETTGSTIADRFEDWWGRDAQGNKQPYIDTLQITHNMDRNAQEAAFAAGQLDVYQFASKPPYDALVKAYPKAETKIFYSNHSPGILLNLKHKPIDDLRVRRAINLAIDRDELNETVLLGQGLIGLPVVPGIKKGWGIGPEELRKVPGYRTPKQQDLDEAKALLREAGYADGFKMNIVYARTQSSAILAEFLPTQLTRVGITAELQGQDQATATKNARDGNFDAYWYLYGNPKPLLRLEPYFHSQGPFSKGAGINDPELDRLVERLRVEVAVPEQKRLVLEAQKLIMDRVYAATTLDPAIFLITQPWVRDYRPSYSIQADMSAAASTVWIDKDKLPVGRK